MSAPRGNRNNAKGTEWKHAIQWALQEYEKSSVKRGQALRQIAIVVVEGALEGNKDFIQEIGNRLDGKPAQVIYGGGDDGEFEHSMKVYFVDPDDGSEVPPQT